MINDFISTWEANKHKIRDLFSKMHPDSYTDIVKAVIGILDNGDYGCPDSSKIHIIDDGDYQGTQLFVIAEKTYQPRKYWYCYVDYGSCSGCDALEAIRNYDSEPPTKKQTDGYMQLALHVVQGLKEMPP